MLLEWSTGKSRLQSMGKSRRNISITTVAMFRRLRNWRKNSWRNTTSTQSICRKTEPSLQPRSAKRTCGPWVLHRSLSDTQNSSHTSATRRPLSLVDVRALTPTEEQITKYIYKLSSQFTEWILVVRFQTRCRPILRRFSCMRVTK